ncbi:MAG TPA: hypothetical protein VJT79_06525 [Pseudonocardia sp.]|nr:hypothetical protein [Pseudonocardia sp.]
MSGDERDDERPSTPPQGSMRFQDETSRPREPTLAERKAREQAERRQQEAAEQAEADAQRSRTRRKRILIGAGATVGLVAVIAIGYAIAQPDEDVTARCVDDSGVVVDDSNCVTPAASSSNYHSGGGLYPIFIGAGGAQYHYNYGGSGSVGQPVSGGTTTVPRNSTRVSTPSGKSVSVGSSDSSGSKSSVSRGGLGSSSSGSSSGS